MALVPSKGVSWIVMTEDAFKKEANPSVQWYEDDIPLRGYQFSLPQIKAAYRELDMLTKSEGERIVNALEKPEEMSDAEFVERNKLPPR